MTGETVREEREPPRAVWHFALLVLVGAMITGSLLLSARPLTLASFHNVAPAVSAAGSLPDLGDDWSEIVHRSDWRPPVAALLGRTGEARPRLGWVVREWSFLGLPLVAFRQSELALSREDPYGYRLSGLTDAQRGAVARGGGTGWFPFWRYGWGWLAVLAAAGFAWAELKWQARRRALLGVM